MNQRIALLRKGERSHHCRRMRASGRPATWAAPGTGENGAAGRTLRPLRLTKDRKGTIHIRVVRDVTHKAGLRLLIASPVC